MWVDRRAIAELLGFADNVRDGADALLAEIMPALSEGLIDHRHLQRRIYDRPVLHILLPENAELFLEVFDRILFRLQRQMDLSKQFLSKLLGELQQQLVL